MLTITIPKSELYDESRNEFVEVEAVVIELEHSLVSLSKWEESFEKPFLGPGQKTSEETLAYIKHMCLTPNIDDTTWARLTTENLEAINKYLESSMTATTFNEPNKKVGREIITAEIIYYWMITLSIPMECQYWHLNKLFALIKVLNLKNSPPKKMSRQEAAAQQRALNAQRRAQMNSSG